MVSLQINASRPSDRTAFLNCMINIEFAEVGKTDYPYLFGRITLEIAKRTYVLKFNVRF